MAVVHARNAPPYPLISFVVLFVIATALAITFYLSGSKAQEALATMQTQQGKYVGPRDQAFANQLLSEGTGTNPTALGTAHAQLDALKQALGVSADTPVSQIVGKDGLLAQAETSAGHAGTPVLATLQQVTSELDAAKTQLASQQQTLQQLQASATQTKQDYDTAIANAKKTVDDLTAQLTTMTQQAAKMRDARQVEVQQAEEQVSKLQDAAEQARRQSVLQIEQLNTDLNTSHDTINLLRQQVANARGENRTNVGTEPDGTVVRASTGTGECYINLGTSDHVLPGLTFAVYDPRLGVRSGTDQEAAGKGDIEVITAGTNESLCRITHTAKGQVIQPGDLIANPVYHKDRNRKFRFVVYGDFDLDGDGVATAAERERLVSMIKSWGGIIQNKIDTQTDFLVIGSRPSGPIESSSASASQPGSPEAVRSEQQDTYDQIITEAKATSIPILNQNRFLAMIGYYNTTIVR